MVRHVHRRDGDERERHVADGLVVQLCADAQVRFHEEWVGDERHERAGVGGSVQPERIGAATECRDREPALGEGAVSREYKEWNCRHADEQPEHRELRVCGVYRHCGKDMRQHGQGAEHDGGVQHHLSWDAESADACVSVCVASE